MKLLEEKRKFNAKKFQNTYLEMKAKYINVLDYYKEQVSKIIFFFFYLRFIHDEIRILLIYLVYIYILHFLGRKNYKNTGYMAWSC